VKTKSNRLLPDFYTQLVQLRSSLKVYAFEFTNYCKYRRKAGLQQGNGKEKLVLDNNKKLVYNNTKIQLYNRTKIQFRKEVGCK